MKVNKMIENKCHVCGEKNGNTAVLADDYSVVYRCSNCGHLYMKRRADLRVSENDRKNSFQ